MRTVNFCPPSCGDENIEMDWPMKTPWNVIIYTPLHFVQGSLILGIGIGIGIGGNINTLGGYDLRYT